jgi:predicted DNA-binding transcriptional regulator AlpA
LIDTSEFVYLPHDFDMQENNVDDLDSIRVLTRPETIKVLGLSDRTFDRLEAEGDVPTKTRLSTGRIGYRVADIKEWLDRRREGSGEAA